MRAVSITNNKVRSVALENEIGFVDKWAKKLILNWLEQFTEGFLIVEDNGETYCFGDSSHASGCKGKVVVKHPSLYSDLLFNGTTGAGEAYMRGSWTSPDLVSVIRVMCQNMDHLYKINSGWSKINTAVASFIHRYRANSKKNAQLNIAAHYDLGNDLFELFLDPSMMYSSAIYPEESSTLEEAAIYKLEHICQRLQLKPTDHLLEIGTGWGGMAIYAAKTYGCRVTTTTISKEQYQYAVESVEKEGLSDRVTVLLKDYRDLEGEYDKLVSIEMIEAVGRHYYQQYFSTCCRLLRDDGLMLIQAITMPDQRYELTSESADFIQRYIFPGGDLPCPRVIAENMGKYSGLQMVGVEDISFHYARTLNDWRQRFMSKLPEVKKLGYDDVFIRMWEFYLAYCEGGFSERTIGTVQMLMAKPRCKLLPTIQASS